MMNGETFEYWTVFADGTAHALLRNKDGQLIYQCSDVLYCPSVAEVPRTTGFDLVFCSFCLRYTKRMKDTEMLLLKGAKVAWTSRKTGRYHTGTVVDVMPERLIDDRRVYLVKPDMYSARWSDWISPEEAEAV